MKDLNVEEIDGVPTWLETPATGVVPNPLPVQTRIQTLPLKELTWENFERLCLRYVRTRALVVMCQLYGTRGQHQDGIDLYVRLSDPGRYEVYQCKRLAKLVPSDIKKAIDKFLEGKWKDKAKAFRFMTAHPIEEKSIADAIVLGQERLNKLDVEFEVLGQDQISVWLKDQPKTVDDFFSRVWVQPFCNPGSMAALSSRLNGETVALFRTKLKAFYEFVFDKHDPGIPVKAAIGDREIPITDRFVVPGIYGNLNAVQDPQPPSIPEANGKTEEPTMSPSFAISGLRTRFDADKWIGQSPKSVILGVPGSGKSALLRALALELLSETKMFPQTAIRWGTMLPVWIPFPFWTTLNAKRDTAISLPDCLEAWFKQFDQAEVWSLVKEAIEDERLLLLVDGLDEWTDPVAARTASTQLQAFIQLRNLPAVVVSRPRGFERVSIQGADWQIGTLATLSVEQQEVLVKKWLTIHRSRNVSQKDEVISTGSDDVATEAENFMRKLARSRDLSQLAEVPLTLLLLLYLQLQNTPLPTNRFEAYEYVVRHFIKEHPLSRKTAASLTDSFNALEDDETRQALAYVAFEVQSSFPSGALTDDELLACLDRFLKEDTDYGLALSRQEANEVKKAFANIEEGSLGLLVSQAQGHIGFFHRSVQEYLASVHVARMPLADQTKIIQDHLADSRWRDVIAGVIHLCQRADDVAALVDGIEGYATDSIGSLSKDDILAELAFRNTKLPPARSQALTTRAFSIIETSFVISHKSRILLHAMSGLHIRKNRAAIQDRLRRWIFSRGIWGPGRLDGVESWPADDSTWDLLFRELHDEDAAVIRTAAKAIATLYPADITRGDILVDLALTSSNQHQRSACIEALSKGWSDHPSFDQVLAHGSNCSATEVQLATVLAKVHLKRQQDADLHLLLSLAHDRIGSSLAYAWQDEVVDVLVQGWGGDARLKSACLESVRQRYMRGQGVSKEYAQSILIKGFPQDGDVADWIAEELKQNYPFNSGRREAWCLLPQCYRDNPVVVEALDLWASLPDYRDVMALHYGALVGRTPTMKQRLLKALDESLPFWAIGALLTGWGMNDEEVASRLRQRAAKEDADGFAQYLPEILGTEARQRLLELLRAAEKHPRIDFMMTGFSKLAEPGNKDEIIDAAIARFNQNDWLKDQYAGALIATCPDDPRVKALARENMRSQSPSFAAIVEAAAKDEKLRQEVAELISPLSVDLRLQIVTDLPVFADHEFTALLLKDWDSERHAEIKTLASIQYHQTIQRSPSDVESAVLSLLKMFPCYGPDHEARRQAAGAGLIVLRKLDKIAGKVETVGFQGQPINIALTDGSRQNRVFVDLLAKNWAYVKQIAGEDLALLKERGGSSHILDTMAATSADDTGLVKDILQRADNLWELRRSANVLRLMARTEPKSERLLSSCLETFRSNDPNWYGWYDSVEVASEIIAEQFRGDNEVENRIIAIANPESIPTAVIMALSLGWPNNPLLRDLGFGRRSREITAAELYTKYAIITAQQIPGYVASDIAWAQRNPYQVTMFSKPLLARLRYDVDAAQEMFAFLEKSSNSDVKASFPRLIAATGGMTTERLTWCSRELERQTQMESPEFGFDVLSRSQRSIRLTLLDAVGAVDGVNSSSHIDVD
jgi:hypothetical protein